MLRAIRFAVQLDFQIESKTWSSLCALADRLERISRERIRDEWFKILAQASCVRGVTLVRSAGMLAQILPVAWTPETIDRAMDGLQRFVSPAAAAGEPLHQEIQADPLFRLAGMLWSMELDDHKNVDPLHLWRYGHLRKKLNAALPNLNQALASLKLSRSQEQTMLTCVAVANAIVRLSEPNLPPHRWMSALGWSGGRAGFLVGRRGVSREKKAQDQVDQLCNNALSLAEDQYNPRPWVTGDDLRDLGLTPGPHFKDLLAKSFADQLDGRFQTREDALQEGE